MTFNILQRRRLTTLLSLERFPSDPIGLEQEHEEPWQVHELMMTVAEAAEEDANICWTLYLTWSLSTQVVASLCEGIFKSKSLRGLHSVSLGSSVGKGHCQECHDRAHSQARSGIKDICDSGRRWSAKRHGLVGQIRHTEVCPRSFHPLCFSTRSQESIDQIPPQALQRRESMYNVCTSTSHHR